MIVGVGGTGAGWGRGVGGKGGGGRGCRQVEQVSDGVVCVLLFKSNMVVVFSQRHGFLWF